MSSETVLQLTLNSHLQQQNNSNKQTNKQLWLLVLSKVIFVRVWAEYAVSTQNGHACVHIDQHPFKVTQM